MTPFPASTLLGQLSSNIRRSLGQREVAVHGSCLLLLVALLAFAASSPISVLVVWGMLWTLGHEQRRGAQHPRDDRTRLVEADRKADDEAGRLLLCANENHNDEEGAWK